MGLNNHADDKDPFDRAVYGIHTGVVALLGVSTFFLDIGLGPGTYFHKQNTFVNLNGWFGFRWQQAAEKGGILISLGYTPRLFTTRTYPDDHFVNALAGIKIGFCF